MRQIAALVAVCCCIATLTMEGLPSIAALTCGGVWFILAELCSQGERRVKLDTRSERQRGGDVST